MNIDEAHAFVAEGFRAIPLAHRRKHQRDGDGHGQFVILERCPKLDQAGNCGQCYFHRIGGELVYDAFKIPQLQPPRTVDTKTGPCGPVELREFLRPLMVEAGVTYKLGGEFVRVGATTFAASLKSWNGTPIDSATRRTAEIYRFERGQTHDPRTPIERVEDMLKFAFNPVVVREHPVDESGSIVTSGTLAERIERKQQNWDDGILFPRDTCEVPRLRFTDLLALEQIRRYAAKHKVGVIFAGATMSATGWW